MEGTRSIGVWWAFPAPFLGLRRLKRVVVASEHCYSWKIEALNPPEKAEVVQWLDTSESTLGLPCRSMAARLFLPCSYPGGLLCQSFPFPSLPFTSKGRDDGLYSFLGRDCICLWLGGILKVTGQSCPASLTGC